MTIDFDTQIQTYKWTMDKNKLPFNWKCAVCGTITEIIESDTTKKYDCSNPSCPYKLKFTT